MDELNLTTLLSKFPTDERKRIQIKISNLKKNLNFVIAFTPRSHQIYGQIFYENTESEIYDFDLHSEIYNELAVCPAIKFVGEDCVLAAIIIGQEEMMIQACHTGPVFIDNLNNFEPISHSIHLPILECLQDIYHQHKLKNSLCQQIILNDEVIYISFSSLIAIQLVVSLLFDALVLHCHYLSQIDLNDDYDISEDDDENYIDKISHRILEVLSREMEVASLDVEELPDDDGSNRYQLLPIPLIGRGGLMISHQAFINTIASGKSLSGNNQFQAIIYEDPNNVVRSENPLFVGYCDTVNTQSISRGVGKKLPKDTNGATYGSSYYGAVSGVLGRLKNRLLLHSIESDDESNLQMSSSIVKVHDLHASTLLRDPPRRVNCLSIDPTSQYCAICDNLGRVTLHDLQSRNLVRIWKGLRDATCGWVEENDTIFENGDKIVRKSTCLAIFAKKKNCVEFWKVPHGHRKKVVQVSEGSIMIEFTSKINTDSFRTCCIVESLGGGTDARLTVLDSDESLVSIKSIEASLSIDSPQIELQLFRQLVSPDSNLPTSLETIYDALLKLPSLSDLVEALDLLACSTYIEDFFGIVDSSFHKKAVKVAMERINEVKKGFGQMKTPIKTVEADVRFHQKVIELYDTLYNFQPTSTCEDRPNIKNEDPFQSSWAVEAVGWVQAFSTVTGANIDANSLISTQQKFSSFYKGCASHKKKNAEDYTQEKIYLTDSKKDRVAILSHIFRPLLHDIFVFKDVNSYFERMGVDEEYSLLQQYFGEWFMTLKVKVTIQASLYGDWCPALNWLTDLVLNILDDSNAPFEVGNDTRRHSSVLSVLFRFCEESEMLPNVFLLAATCREAVSNGSKQIENQSYGKVILWSEAVKPWDDLLRKLRVCLLLRLRIAENDDSTALKVTVQNIREYFTIYSWIAEDELLISHNFEEIVSIEKLCAVNGFDPLKSTGDLPSMWKQLQKSCLVSVNRFYSSGLTHSDPDDNLYTPLVYYFPKYNNPITLGLHRALLLSKMWGRKPSSLSLLKNCVNSFPVLMSSSYNDLLSKSKMYAVALEIWQSYLRPVCRSILFGFDDVLEVSENVLSPLYRDLKWVTEFTKVSMNLLSILKDLSSKVVFTERGTLSTYKKLENYNGWDAESIDPTIRGALAKAFKALSASINHQKAIICALKTSAENVSLLTPLLQGSMFQKQSLFKDITAENEFLYIQFMERVIWSMVQKQSVLVEEVRELQELGHYWNLPRQLIDTRFIVALYRAAKDSLVDSLFANTSASTLDSTYYVEQVSDIVSVRLYLAIEALKKMKNFRIIIGRLDADLCELTKLMALEADQKSKNQQLPNIQIQSISLTHNLISRGLKIAGEDDVNDELLVTIEKLHTLSSHLVNATERELSSTKPTI